jgi:HSP20 family protein
MFAGMPPTGRGMDPFREIQRAQSDLNRLFGVLRLQSSGETPPLNIWTGLEGAIVAAEVPGVAPEDLDITIRRDVVTLRGVRKPEPIDDGAVAQRRERVLGAFARTIVLPFPVDGDKASARFERGVLTLTLPRPEEDKPRQIKVMRA